MTWTNENIHNLQVGSIFYHYQQSFNGRKFYKTHIVAVIEEEDDNTHVVFKWYGQYKQRWHYEVDSMARINHNLSLKLYGHTENELREHLATGE